MKITSLQTSVALTSVTLVFVFEVAATRNKRIFAECFYAVFLFKYKEEYFWN